MRQISGGIRVRIPQELDVVAFWSWNLNVVAFSPLKKRHGITMSWLICLRFSMLWRFSPRISMSWFFGLGIPMSWYMCLHGFICVITVKKKKSRIIMSIMLLKNISIVQIYATSICIMMHKQIRIINRILIHRKTSVLESFLNKVAGLKACDFMKKSSNPVFFLWILWNL